MNKRVAPPKQSNMDHRAISLKFLRSTSLIPVKVRPGQKDPFPEWDPRSAVNEDHALTLKVIESTPELNLGALFAGRYVDLDVDSSAPYLHAALDYFLPRTPYVWGRHSKPRSHRVYALHEDFDRAPWGNILRYIKNLVPGKIDEESYSVELRGGKPENGLFSVLPGSKHPSGEQVEWDSEIDPTVGGAYVEVERIVKALRLAVAVSMIVPWWQPGQRNDISLALAGTLWRIRTATRAAYGLEVDEEADPLHFVLSEDDAKAMFTCIMKLADDTHGDERQRMLNLTNTWKKLDAEAGSKVTGGKVLAELVGGDIGKNVVKSLYRLLSDNDAAEQIEKLAEQFVMWYGQGVLIDLQMVATGRMVPWMSREQASNSLGGKKLIIGEKKIPLVNMLFGTTIINRVMGLTFDPSSEEMVVQTPDGLMVNQWRGWATEPCTQRVTDAEVEPFLSYVMDVLASGEQDRYDWIMAWLADMFQKPAKKPGTALVLVGVQGAGKTFLGEHIIGKIIGGGHYAQINSITKLTDKFNTVIDNKVFLQCDEAVHSYQKDVASRLKSIITDQTLIIEPKGVNSFNKPNHLHLLFTSNDETAALFIDASPYERRFTVIKVSEHRAMDLDYWSFMHLWVPTALPKILRYLQDYKYNRTLISRPLETEAKRDVQRVGVDPEVSWMLARVAAGFPLGARYHQHWFEAYKEDELKVNDPKHNNLRRDHWPDTVVAAAIEQDFKSYIREHGRAVYTGSVSTTLRRVLPKDAMQPKSQKTIQQMDPRSGQVTHSRVRFHTFPSKEQIMQHLRSRYGPVVDVMYEDMQTFPDEERVDGQQSHTEEREF